MKEKLLLIVFLITSYVNAQCWQSVTSGADFSLALRNDRTLWAWGHNESGQLGIGSFEDSPLPVKVGEDSDWESVSAGYGFTVALKTDGTMWVWGRNDFGLGSATGNISNVPSQVGTDTDWRFISAGGAHTLAIKDNGTLWAWGRNDFGQLGNNSVIHSNIPVQVGNDTDWQTVATGTFHNLAMKANTTLWSWGYNFAGQLGHGTAGFGTEVIAPQQIMAAEANAWKGIATGGRHSLAIKENGQLLIWGNNNSFALGINDGSTYKPLPTLVNNTNWERAYAGINQTYAVKDDGTLWAWGTNTDGQLGDGSTINRPVPVQIGPDANWTFMDGGEQHSAFLRGDNLFSSGNNNYGQLGIGSNANHTTLQEVTCPPLNIEEHDNLSFSLYPSPATETVLVQNFDKRSIEKIIITDSNGRTLVTTYDPLIDVSAFQSGLYWARIYSGNEIFNIRFIKI